MFHTFEISDHWYLEAADFLGVFCLGEGRYPALEGGGDAPRGY